MPTRPMEPTRHQDVPVAYLLTWTCYGTWLHGDPRGSVDDEHREPGTPPLDADVRRQGTASLRRAAPTMELDGASRGVVRRAIEDHAAVRRWTIHAVAVRTNHVHMVISADRPPEPVMGQLKAWATRRLRSAGIVPGDARVWTNQGSNRYLWDRGSLAAAVRYVENQ